MRDDGLSDGRGSEDPANDPGGGAGPTTEYDDGEKPKRLRLGLINIQGLTSECNCKIKSSEFKAICKNYDILMLNETWTSEESDVANGFEHIVLNRTEKKAGTKRNSGGLIVYIRSKLFDNNMFLNFENDVIIWLKLKDNIISDKPTYICLCYVLPAAR